MALILVWQRRANCSSEPIIFFLLSTQPSHFSQPPFSFVIKRGHLMDNSDHPMKCRWNCYMPCPDVAQSNFLWLFLPFSLFLLLVICKDYRKKMSEFILGLVWELLHGTDWGITLHWHFFVSQKNIRPLGFFHIDHVFAKI